MSVRSRAFVALLWSDLLGSVVWFPVWWYTKGLQNVARALIQRLRFRIAKYGIQVWLTHFFVPMYGQYDLLGRVVSVVMRTVVLSGRLIVLGIEAFVYLCAFVGWLVILPLVIGLLILNLFSFVPAGTGVRQLL